MDLKETLRMILDDGDLHFDAIYVTSITDCAIVCNTMDMCGYACRCTIDRGRGSAVIIGAGTYTASKKLNKMLQRRFRKRLDIVDSSYLGLESDLVIHELI